MSSYPKVATCPRCSGSGRVTHRQEVDCPQCLARGVVPGVGQAKLCPACAGKKKVAGDRLEPCGNCGGAGGRIVNDADEECLFTGIHPVTGQTKAQLAEQLAKRQRDQEEARKAAEALEEARKCRIYETNDKILGAFGCCQALLLLAAIVGAISWVLGLVKFLTVLAIVGPLAILLLILWIVKELRPEMESPEERRKMKPGWYSGIDK